MDEQKARAAFEQWHAQSWGDSQAAFLRRDDAGGYTDRETQGEWEVFCEAWKAGRAAMREAAAHKVVEMQAWRGGHGEPPAPTASELADVIRQLPL